MCVFLLAAYFMHGNVLWSPLLCHGNHFSSSCYSRRIWLQMFSLIISIFHRFWELLPRQVWDESSPCSQVYLLSFVFLEETLEKGSCTWKRGTAIFFYATSVDKCGYHFFSVMLVSWDFSAGALCRLLSLSYLQLIPCYFMQSSPSVLVLLEDTSIASALLGNEGGSWTEWVDKEEGECFPKA